MGAGGVLPGSSPEVAPFGIKVTLVEPTGFATDWSGPVVQAEPLPAYDAVPARSPRLGRTPGRTGDPEASAAAILKIVDAQNPPLRVFFGRPAGDARADYESRLATWEQWQAVSVEAQG